MFGTTPVVFSPTRLSPAVHDFHMLYYLYSHMNGTCFGIDFVFFGECYETKHGNIDIEFYLIHY